MPYARKPSPWATIKAWPGRPKVKRSPGPVEVQFRGSARADRDDRKPADPGQPAVILPSNLARGFNQVEELHALLEALEATVQRLKIRTHIVEGVLMDLAGTDEEVKS